MGYLGGGISQTADEETPTVPGDEFDDGPDATPDDSYGKGGVGGESEDENDIDSERAE